MWCSSAASTSPRPPDLRGGLDAEVAELAVERRAADAEPASHLRHTSAIVADGEADNVGFDFLERPQMAFARVERHARRPADRFVAVRLAEGRGEIAAAAGVARLDRDMRELLGGQRIAVAMQSGAEQ